ncbi:hypothetical protein [Chrysodeixis includens nucleopolyhedrovirus]|uniref:Uncharacterized protein n=1 Tax=Chrysodeixis includens nucleopolyhedrovirus TaxID=1207438 RepID=A0A5B8YU17_9ABAC|nr:hypothetical protein QKU06_gp103 [Chrysodeixis includens nucleopolyhedrovirus]QED40631.1 hypothetical protein [Chrysodeixis includens nucleopolyhedrovirus]
MLNWNRNASVDRNGRPAINNVLGLISVIDTSKPNGRQLFYNLCLKAITLGLRNSGTFKGFKALINLLIESEKLLFDSNRVLSFIRNFLIAHSDGDNMQCAINLQLLDYVLTTYH